VHIDKKEMATVSILPVTSGIDFATTPSTRGIDMRDNVRAPGNPPRTRMPLKISTFLND
jgi:hypothetical protein